MYLLRFCWLMLRMGYSGVFLRASLENAALRKLREIEAELSGKFSPKTLKKIIRYNSIHHYLGFYIFIQLQGRKISKREVDNLLHYSVMHVLFDDFFDEKTHTLEQICEMTFNAENYKPINFEERAFNLSGLHLLHGVRDRQAYLEDCRKLMETQKDSLEQFNENIDIERLKKITFAKGLSATSLCKYYIDNDISIEEVLCWDKLGELVQIGNDIYDIYNDLNDGIHTLPIRLGNAYELEKLYHIKVSELLECINNLPYPSGKKKNFRILTMWIISVALVGIDNLKKLQGKNESLPDLKSLPRKALIVDMEKTGNILKWFFYTYSFGNRKK